MLSRRIDLHERPNFPELITYGDEDFKETDLRSETFECMQFPFTEIDPALVPFGTLLAIQNHKLREKRLWTHLQAFLSGTIRSMMMMMGRKSAFCSFVHAAFMYSHSRFMLAIKRFVFAAIFVVYQQVHKKNATLSDAEVLEMVSSSITNAMLDKLSRWEAEKKSLSDTQIMFWALTVTLMCSTAPFDHDFEQAYSTFQDFLQSVCSREFAC